ncbi:unnamed protein product [Euphydryas editha]|uniref:Tectonic domain-containing protein n=1 Tax=Euphydryas editha TaxID=104508 RepID=A0AAU9V4J5_EUPED|nr:unnamed protein product [Euphydryas editha]
MDFINERIHTDDSFINHKRTVAENLSYVLKNIKEKPHALYYRNEQLKSVNKNNKTQYKKYSNLSLPISTFQTSTELASTVFDLIYDENVSMIDSTLTTETYYNESDFDNVTEISFFDKNMTPKPTDISKKPVSKQNCECNLLFNKCDINCCCDSECSKAEYNLFINCKEKNNNQCFNNNRKIQFYCFFQDTCSSELASNIFNHIFCIEKVNLPEKKMKIMNEFSNIDVNKYFKWHSYQNNKLLYQFTKSMYLYGQPVWLEKNETLNIISLPITVTNSYCSGKKPIQFLTNEHIKCYVKIKDLHYFYALEASADSNVISPTQNTTNSTILNCTTLNCINWTVLACDDYNCVKYNKSLHEPSCSESHCHNIGVKVEYMFYCNESIITKAIMKLYVKQVSMDIGYISQEVIVTFYMGNDSIEDIVIYSGNPGYIRKLPVIASFFEGNHTIFFHNRSQENYNNLLLPYNENGKCVITNIKHNILKFGINARIKCRLTFGKINATHNKTDQCIKIQMEVIDLLRLNNDIFISPYGNPSDISDNKWIKLQKFNKTNIHGEYDSKSSKLKCYNFITRFSYIFTYIDIDDVRKEENKILSASVEGTANNYITFNIKDLSAVITVDTSFIDVSSPGTRGYVGLLNTHLTKNLIFPFNNDSCKCNHYNFLLFLCTIFILSK